MNLQGLDPKVAERLLQENGPNEISLSRVHNITHIALEILREPMTILLAACGFIYAFLGELQDAVMLTGFWGLIVGITFYQERKTERALEALRDLSSPRAVVIRAGRQFRIPARELVVGDVVQLAAGDIVPADVLINEVLQAEIDESLLSGESFPVAKKIGESAWSGTTVVQGQIVATVTGTGVFTRLGQIGKILKSEKRQETSLKIETQKVVMRLTAVAVLLSVVTAAIYFVLNRDILGGVLVGLTLAMAILPNEIPAVLTIFLTLGTRHLSQRNVLTRKISAVENIGATTILCVDKTGTLTLNKMKLQKVVLSSDEISENEFLRIACLASNLNSYDPMETALVEAYGRDPKQEAPCQQFPLSPDFFAISNLWEEPTTNKLFIATKGAPETIFKMSRLAGENLSQAVAHVNELASQGLRVLAVAKGSCRKEDIPQSQKNLTVEFLGLIAFADPVRPGVKESIQECYKAGVRLVMMTGDHSQTAAAVAKEIGLQNPREILTGADLEKMTDEELTEHLKAATCFSRMLPEQKLRIVKALQRQGEVVAMTGDGVNDAPALSAAQIGIAMGKKGTDVAREAASVVLLDDDFTTIVEGIRLGRGIYDNLQSAMSYLLAVHVPIAGISVLPVLLNLPIILMPVHVAFLHLIIEPTCSLVFEAEPTASDLMRKPPRKKSKPIFSRKVVVPSLFQGLAIYAVIFFVFVMALKRGQGELDARALAFTILVFANMALIFINRSWARAAGWRVSIQNKYLIPVLLVSASILLAVLYIPSLRNLFHFSFLHLDDLAIALTAAVLSTLCFEAWRHFKERRSHER